ncbi:MAG TPA: type II toxin-antitoxin system RelE/ParE family toxin [Candidatus Paceibacterota bacterium]
MFRIGFAPSASKEFKRLPKAAKTSIAALLDGPFSQDPYSRALPTKKLRTPFPGYRLRCGEYRILYTIEDTYIKVYSVRHRKDAYRQ